MSGASLANRVTEVAERCAVADVQNKLIGKLSKGYRQRVGLAQAIIHNPDVLILDEPTAGLDPKQINETRDLIRSLARDHTILLSTHILPEVEQTCEQVLIINKGKLVATDSVHNLQARARGAESVVLEVEGRSGASTRRPSSIVWKPSTASAASCLKDHANNRSVFEVESLKDRFIRGDLARAIVESGWNLNELRPSAMSLEEIFLQLTGGETTGGEKTDDAVPAEAVAQGESQMRNIWVICRKELHSYFVSPVAYLLLTMFAIIFGFFFWNSVGYFNAASLQSQMSGQAMPMSVNEYVIRPLLSNISVIGLFFIPMITMRLFAEEKRTGTIELLATSPIRDIEIIIGKWLSALILYGVLLLFSAINFAFLFRYGNPDWKPLAIGYLGLLLQAGGLLAIGTFISTLTKNQIIAGAATFGVCLLLWVLEWVPGYETATWAKVLAYMSVITHFDSFSKGVLDTKDAVFYLSVIFLGLFLTSRSMESLRWRS